MYKAIIFDVDGTLVNPENGVLSALHYTIAKHRLGKIDNSVAKSFIGPPIRDSLMEIFGMSQEKAQICTNTFRTIYGDKYIYFSHLYEGIVELLNAIFVRNIKLGVATYKRQDHVSNLLKYLEISKYFNAICGSDIKGKMRKIDILDSCVNTLSCNKDEIIMVGDSYHDAQAAKELGIDFIGVTYGFGFKSFNDMARFLPIFCADSPTKITLSIDEILKTRLATF